MLTLIHLPDLDAVARLGSVTQAAQELHYSQPSVSHQLGRLRQPRVPDSCRGVGRGIRFTPEGELLARRPAEIVYRVDAASDDWPRTSASRLVESASRASNPCSAP